jgi:zinc/manganese transport system substrate-binding protein
MKKLILALCVLVASAEEPLSVCATIPDLGDLTQAVGGELVKVTVFARGGDDPHFVDPKPSFAKALSRADLVVSVGMELEVGWLPVVQTQARNPRIAKATPGYFEACSAIQALGIPTGTVDRSAGHVHGGGNPHFLTDPVCGVQVAKALAKRLGELRPAHAQEFQSKYQAFALTLAKNLLGAAAVQRCGDKESVLALEQDKLQGLIGDGKDLAGWLGQLRPFAKAKLIADHDLWPYLTRRFDLEVVAFLEPKPGVPPSTKHLAEVIQTAKNQGVKAIITVPYFDARHAAFVAKETGLPVLALANQAGSVSGVENWLAMIQYNVLALTKGLENKK